MAELMGGASLADAVAAVRVELLRAQEEARQGPVSFRLGTVEMEFEVAVTRSATYSGKLSVMVVTDDDGGKSSDRDRTTHRVKLTLEPAQLGDYLAESAP